MTERPILLAGGEVVDGTGRSRQPADVLVMDGRIAAVGPGLPAPADTRIVDVAGRVVTPGFIDLHSHGDISVLAFPAADSAVRQGITTVVTGNCGGGVAPLTDPASVGAVAFGFDPAWGVHVDWTTFGAYAERLDGAAVNVAPLVAHGTIRNCVMGLDERPATAPELAGMRALLNAALDEGAFGMSTGLEYRPGMWAAPEEIRTLVGEVGARGRMYATHIRDRAGAHGSATAEAITAAAGTGAHLQLSHFSPRPNATDAARNEAFRRVADAMDAGERIGIDTFPEVWGPALLIDLLPPGSLEGSPAEVLARLDSPARADIERAFTSSPRFLAQVAGYEQIYVTDAPHTADAAGRSLPELAERAGASVARVCLELLLDAGESFRGVAIRHLYATESDLARTLALPCCSIISDGLVTSGEGDRCGMRWNASSYGYVARVLEHFVRTSGTLSLEEAVRRMTSLPAAQLGVSGRGTIRPGHHADLVVFDPARIHDRSSPDDMARHPTGIDHVLVNGRFAVAHAAATAGRHGRRLRP